MSELPASTWALPIVVVTGTDPARSGWGRLTPVAVGTSTPFTTSGLITATAASQ
ncbi:hypothetical protein [Streptacidiphilus carbonis]|jgi:hypothetical protein|uniref:hypothetical protein n=1 Tax=Streptacidiphilus carbonis TaxID=105422 RepID=UPI00137694F0|nr:hypothetical protein [Streptacidiphilus carbonis]